MFSRAAWSTRPCTSPRSASTTARSYHGCAAAHCSCDERRQPNLVEAAAQAPLVDAAMHVAPFRLRDRALKPRLRRRELPLRREACAQLVEADAQARVVDTACTSPRSASATAR